jgi:ABC-2 type transport system ATP-binding protein
VIEVDRLTKTFAVRRSWSEIIRHPFKREFQTAISGVSLSIREGEFFGLLGPNGAGKSTLFKMLATLILPDEGTAVVSGIDVTEDGAAVRQILTPVVPDERSLYWRLSARENLRLYAALHQTDAAKSEGDVSEMLEVVGLSDTAEKMVGQFSSGMKQRLLIARALLARPQVLLLDEPTRSLDPLSAKAFRTFLREEIADAQGVTILLATHNAEEALELCDRLAVLNHGRLLAVGTVDELRQEAGDDTYRSWLRAPEGWTSERLEGMSGAHSPIDRGVNDEGWQVVDVRVPGGAEDAASLLFAMQQSGVSVSRFQRLEMTLADLLERIVGNDPQQAKEAVHA